MHIIKMSRPLELLRWSKPPPSRVCVTEYTGRNYHPRLSSIFHGGVVKIFSLISDSFGRHFGRLSVLFYSWSFWMSFVPRFAFVYLTALLCNHPLSVCTAVKGLTLWVQWTCHTSDSLTVYGLGLQWSILLFTPVKLQIYNVMFCPHMTLPLKHKVPQ